MSELRRVSLAVTWGDDNRAIVQAVPEPEQPVTRLVLSADDCAANGCPLSAVAAMLKRNSLPGAKGTNRGEAPVTG